MAALLIWLLPFPLEQRLIAALLVCRPHRRNGYCILRQAPVRSQCIRHGNFPDHPISIAVMLGLSLF